MELRPYQQAAVDAVYAYLREKDGNPLVVAPTGSGKSLLIAQIASDAVRRWDGRVLVLAHVQELLEQNADKIRKLSPELNVGIHSAGLGSRDTLSNVICGGIQSCYRRAHEFGHFDLVIVDECFPAGTLVDGKPIEELRPGDMVSSFNHRSKRMEQRRIMAVSRRPMPERMARVTLADGRQIIATPRHPFFTGDDYVPAESLVADAVVYVPRMRTGYPRAKRIAVPQFPQQGKDVLLQGLLATVRQPVVLASEEEAIAKETEAPASLALPIVQLPRMRPGYPRSNPQTIQGVQADKENVLRQELFGPVLGPKIGPEDEDSQPDADPCCSRTGVSNAKAHGAPACCAGRQGARNDKTAGDPHGPVGADVEGGDGHPNRPSKGKRKRNVVRCRSGARGIEGLRRGRWRVPQDTRCTEAGCSQGPDIAAVRVDHVEIIECGNSDGPSSGLCERYVYNLHVDGNENYFANDILVHNCHMIPPDGDGMYRTLLADLKRMNPSLRLIGLTATPFRMASGHLCGPENLFTEVCYEISVKELIAQGYLCPLITKAGIARVDTSGLHVRGGEYIAGEVEKLMDDDALIEAACLEIVEYTKDRQSCLIFASGVQHGTHVAEKLESLGQKVSTIFGDTLDFVREQTIADFRSGKLKYLVNVNVLTTGFDAPNIDCVAMLRPTLSPGLYSQCFGRGFRLHPGKQNCLALDFGGNALRHGPVDALRIKSPGGIGDGEAPAKECPDCHAIIATGYTVCPHCGHPFQRQQTRHDATATDEGILSGQVTNRKQAVQSVRYYVHEKRGAPPDAPRTMRVEYQLGYNSYRSEWICIEHSGYARLKAEKWWSRRSNEPMPATAVEAVDLADSGVLLAPTAITVRHVAGEQYDRIVAYEFDQAPAPATEPEYVQANDDLPF